MRLCLLLAVLSLFIASCAESEAGEKLAGISIQPAEVTLLLGDTIQLEVEAWRPDGARREGELLAQWSSEDPEIATVSEDGVVDGLSQGETLIRTSLGAHSAETRVRVEAPLTLEIVLHRRGPGYSLPLQSDRQVRLEVGQNFDVEAIAYQQDGRPLPITSPYWFDWAVSDSSVVRFGEYSTAHSWSGIEESRELEVVGAGQAVARVSFAGSSAEFEVEVLPRAQSVRIDLPGEIMVGERLPLGAEVLDDKGSRIPERIVEWSSSKPSILSVEGEEAVALEAGEARITGTSWGWGPGGSIVSASQAVVVHP